MSRKKIDADMMREVVADLDVESTERASAHLQLMAPPESAITVAENSPVISYPAASAGGSSRWALGIGGVAASLLIAFGLVSYSHGKLGRLLPVKAAASTGTQTSIPSAPAPAQSTVQATISPSEKTEDVSAAATVSPSPLPAPVQPSADSGTGPADVQKTVKVTVRPGETLQQIALRTLGQNDSKLIRQIQELNPSLKNPDHIEADQEIRLPLLAKTTNPAGAPGAN
jgi:hypothetical protein